MMSLRPTRPRRVALLLLLLVPLATAGGAAPENPPNPLALTARWLFAPVAVAGYYQPLVVSLALPAPRELVLDAQAGAWRTRLVTRAAAGAVRLTFGVALPPGARRVRLMVQARTDGALLGETTLDVPPERLWSIPRLAADGSPFAALARRRFLIALIDTPESAGRQRRTFSAATGVAVSVAVDELPRRVRALEALDGVAFASATPADCDAEQLRALGGWVRRGGRLYLASAYGDPRVPAALARLAAPSALSPARAQELRVSLATVHGLTRDVTIEYTVRTLGLGALIGVGASVAELPLAEQRGALREIARATLDLGAREVLPGMRAFRARADLTLPPPDTRQRLAAASPWWRIAVFVLLALELVALVSLGVARPSRRRRLWLLGAALGLCGLVLGVAPTAPFVTSELVVLTLPRGGGPGLAEHRLRVVAPSVTPLAFRAAPDVVALPLRTVRDAAPAPLVVTVDATGVAVAAGVRETRESLWMLETAGSWGAGVVVAEDPAGLRVTNLGTAPLRALVFAERFSTRVLGALAPGESRTLSRDTSPLRYRATLADIRERRGAFAGLRPIDGRALARELQRRIGARRRFVIGMSAEPLPPVLGPGFVRTAGPRPIVVVPLGVMPPLLPPAGGERGSTPD